MRDPPAEQGRGGIPAKSQKHVSESAGDAPVKAYSPTSR